ncbi:hypothetical protein QP157_12345 [Sphingomonas sp. LR61]|uniref:hypothetical protein n=1 Tax=Sphingomonas sp. LR61 TaxID=3050234 RepID=UPI002FE0BBDC
MSDRLSIAGVDTHVEAMSWSGLALYLLAYTPLVMAAAVVGGASWLAGRVRGLAQVRAQAVLRVHGVLGPFVRDITASVLVASAAFVISAGPAILLVHAYNGGHQLWSYLAISAVLLGGSSRRSSSGHPVPDSFRAGCDSARRSRAGVRGCVDASRWRRHRSPR